MLTLIEFQTFAFGFSDFESLLWSCLDCFKFLDFGLGNGKSSKNQYHSYQLDTRHNESLLMTVNITKLDTIQLDTIEMPNFAWQINNNECVTN